MRNPILSKKYTDRKRNQTITRKMGDFNVNQ